MQEVRWDVLSRRLSENRHGEQLKHFRVLYSINVKQKVMLAFPILIACVSLKILNLDTTALKMVEKDVCCNAFERLLK